MLSLSPNTKIFAALLCSLLWGGQAAAVKIAAEFLDPLVILSSRFLIAGAVLAAYVFVTKTDVVIGRVYIPNVLMLTLLLGIQIGLFIYGTSKTSSLHSIVLINTYPIFVTVFSAALLSVKHASMNVIGGFSLAFVGLILIFHDKSNTNASSAGDLLVIAAATSIGLRTVLTKKLLQSITPFKLTCWVTWILAPVTLILAFVFTEMDLTALTLPDVGGAILYQGLVVSIFASFLWNSLLKVGCPTRLSVIRMTSPVFGAAFGVLFLQEQLTIGYLLGLVIILAGVSIARRENIDRRTRTPSAL